MKVKNTGQRMTWKAERVGVVTMTKKSSVLRTISKTSLLGTRNSSGDEIANVNYLCNDIVHALKIQ